MLCDRYFPHFSYFNIFSLHKGTWNKLQSMRNTENICHNALSAVYTDWLIISGEFMEHLEYLSKMEFI